MSSKLPPLTAARRRFLQRAAAAPLALWLPLPIQAQAQAWPAQPLRVLVSFPGGGTLDVVVRLVAQAMSATLGQPIVVDNKPGGGTVIGTALAAKAPADGLTLLAVSNSFTINPALLPSLPFDTVRDFQPLGLMASTPLVLCARNGLPATTLAGVAAALQSKPDAYTHATPGNGSLPQLLGEMLNTRLGTRIVHIPYKGTPAALAALAAGEVDLSFALLPDVLPLVRAGKINALGVLSASRVAQAPELPTLVEQLPALDLFARGWFALMVPAGVPAAAAQRLDAALAAALLRPEVQATLVARGYDAESGGTAALQTLLTSEMGRYAAVIRQNNIRVE